MTHPSDPAPLRLQVRSAVTPADVLTHPDLTGDDTRLYGILYLHANVEGASFPGRRRLASLCHCAERTIDGSVERLRDAGFLATRRRWTDASKRIYYEGGSGRVQTSTEYVLLVMAAQGGTAPGAPPSGAQGTAGNSTRRTTTKTEVLRVQQLHHLADHKPKPTDPWELVGPETTPWDY
jgi:hypothetical protein